MIGYIGLVIVMLLSFIIFTSFMLQIMKIKNYQSQSPVLNEFLNHYQLFANSLEINNVYKD